MTENNAPVMLKPSAIAAKGLIVNSNGKPSYRYILNLIKTGQLKARPWTSQGVGNGTRRDQFLVSMDEINRYNRSLQGATDEV